MLTSVSAGIKYEYDGADGNPVDITAEVLTINDIDQANMLQQTDPFGTSMPEFTPTGRGSFKPIQLGGIFKTGSGTIDAQFGGRIPEAVDTPARTLKITWATGRSTSVETHLSDFKRSPNKDNGLTRFTVELQPTGVITETGIVTP